MRVGLASGHKGVNKRRELFFEIFLKDNGGYTTVSVALALLLSITLIFSLAGVQWINSRSADIQEVADAAAMAGENCVAKFSTVVQVSDVCVLTLGLAALSALGSGLILSFIPFTHAAGSQIFSIGKQLIDVRRNFAHSAAKGLSKLESVLPVMIAANASSCIFANNSDSLRYSGSAIPFPLSSHTDYSFLEDELSGDDLEKNAQELQKISAKKEEAEKEALKAKTKAWRADCVDNPSCLRSRCTSLANLGGALNPNYSDVATWKFEYARIRAYNYYVARVKREEPKNQSVEELTRSAARKQFYLYAERVIDEAVCHEDGHSVDIDLPELPHNSDMIRDCDLYTQKLWPCTQEEQGIVLHSSSSCPGVSTDITSYASLADIDSGVVKVCPVCKMDVDVMGSVASASTNINNGFEYYWKIIVEASREYQKSKQEALEAEKELQTEAEKSAGVFDKAIQMLSVERPDYLPAGAYGCVSIVKRGEAAYPVRLSSSFLQGENLPSGLAISGAVLAAEESSDSTNILSEIFSSISESSDFGGFELADTLFELWGKLLVGYGASYGALAESAGGFFDGIGSTFGEPAASWLKSRISDIVKSTGFEPADMRLKKPVLTHTQNILDKAGEGRESLSLVREWIEKIPDAQSFDIKSIFADLIAKLGGTDFTLATLELPGGFTVPFTIDLSQYLDFS